MNLMRWEMNKEREREREREKRRGNAVRKLIVKLEIIGKSKKENKIEF